MAKIYIGIDPGSHTGIAVWDATAQRLVDVVTLPLHRAMRLVEQYKEQTSEQQGRLLVIFEDARQRKWFKPEKSQSEYRGRLMGAGAAKRDAAIWEDYLNDLGVTFVGVKPKAGATKWSADYWRKVTGWQGRTSEHSRDAALLVYGRR